MVAHSEHEEEAEEEAAAPAAPAVWLKRDVYCRIVIVSESMMAHSEHEEEAAPLQSPQVG